MGWKELQVWLEVMRRQREPVTTAPDSWENAEHDEFWQQVRKDRAERRGEV